MVDTTAGTKVEARRAAISEDWLAVWIGLLVVTLALWGARGDDLLGWVVPTSVWMDIPQGLAPAAKAYAWLGSFGALLATYLALLIVLTTAAAALGVSSARFALAFTAVFFIA